MRCYVCDKDCDTLISLMVEEPTKAGITVMAKGICRECFDRQKANEKK